MASPFMNNLDSLDSSLFDGFDANLLSPVSIPTSDATNGDRPFDWNLSDGSVDHNSNDVPTPKASQHKQKLKNPLPNLACLNCRPKKIRCQREEGSCKRCLKLKLVCVVPDGDERRRPSSKTHIRELESRIRSLEAQLQEQKQISARLAAGTNQALPDYSAVEDDEHSVTDELAVQRTHEPQIDPALTEKPRGLIARLCARQSSFSADEIGQLRFFGATSSLHTAESTSSCFVEWGDFSTKTDDSALDIPLELQEVLLDTYWKYQHTVLQVIHREAFLHDRQNNRFRYYSKALLYAIFACAARISELPYVRSLAFTNEPGTSEPYLLRKAMILVEEELEQSAGITTIQALQLLSVCHCARASDTKGWMESGRAIRLIFELGLHRDSEDLESRNLSRMDLEVRKTVFWGCFTYDRMWSVYLGRPYAIKLEDCTVRRPLYGSESPPWETMMGSAWICLLEIVGDICNGLNAKAHASASFIKTLNQRLIDWRSGLDPSLQYKPGAPCAVGMLHMQFCTAMILLHRPASRFGSSTVNATDTSLEARAICVEYAMTLTTVVSDFRTFHGSARAMLGTALYNITMASIVLVADMADRTQMLDANHTVSIDICIQGLRELEESYIVARTILKQLKYLMKRCQLPAMYNGMDAMRKMSTAVLPQANSMDTESPPQNLNGQVLQPLDSGMGQGDIGADFLMVMEQCDALQSIGTWS